MKKYFAISKKVCNFAADFERDFKGRLAEGLGTGLQNLLLRFKSGSDLKNSDNNHIVIRVFLLNNNKNLPIPNNCRNFAN